MLGIGKYFIRTKLLKALSLICCPTLIFLAGCSNMEVDDFKEWSPKFNPHEFFLGKTTGHGVFYDRWSNIKTSFTVKLVGSLREDDQLELKEDLVYRNGDQLQRTYLITKTASNKYQLECSDLTEPGSITQSGNALLWQYTLLQDIGGTVLALDFDDWMFLQDDHLVLNRAKAYWYGIFVGEVFMVIEKEQLETGDLEKT